MATPESIFTADFIFSRFSFSMALTKSIKTDLTNIRKLIYEQNIESDLLKRCVERIVLSATKVHKLKLNEELVYSGLGDSAKIFELNPLFLNLMNIISKINLTSILLIKTFNTPLNPDKIVFLAPMCKRAMRRCDEISNELTYLVKNEVINEIIVFTETSRSFYKILTMFCIIKINIFEKNNLLPKKKDYKSVIVENFTLSNEINAILAQTKSIKQRMSTFNTSENYDFLVHFTERFIVPILGE